ncbi:PDC sensor domain-containing protein [Streptomyces megasporus]|uniref:PDC sensor domain-containing protein n=1 Tax=Streptomyces megasporus TaxID=44060 RepID=UPI000561E8A6|nr:cache domain-containing protein [Streptomyces megasporus]
MMATEELDMLLERVKALLTEVFDRLETVAGEVVARRRAVLAEGGSFGVREVDALKPILVEQIDAQPAADGFGFFAAAGLLPERDRHFTWWQRGGTGFVQLRLNLDPSSVDVYDYFEMEWFAAGRDRSHRSVFGPYVDYFGADRYVFTLTAPVFDETFLGVVGADLRVNEFEPRLLAALRGGAHDAVLVGPERRVIAANTSRWVIGSRLPRTPRAGEEGFTAVGEVGLDSGWVVALAPRE